jgi:hypothetical protein
MFTPRGIRNLNFGNIEDGPFAQGLPGYAGTDGRFAKFDSPDNGLNAIDTLLAGYGKRGINNVNGVVQRWAPVQRRQQHWCLLRLRVEEARCWPQRPH